MKTNALLQSVIYKIHRKLRKASKMFNHYYVNKVTTGNPNFNHEVHKSSCYYLPSETNRIYLGYFSSCSDAIKAAKAYFSNVDGCAICCPECHRK